MRANPGSPLCLTLAAIALVAPTAAAVTPAAAAAPPLIGVSYSGWSGGFADAATRLQTFRSVGFPLVTLVPAYAYVGRNKIDVPSGPSVAELAGAIEAARRIGLQVVLKPHLEPLGIKPGYRRAQSDNHSWRAECGWRGFFDLDPLTPEYRDGVIFAALRALKEALGKTANLAPADGPAVPVRLELGAELMNSIVEHPERWQGLLRETRRERKRLGLEGQVVLSHNFSHHLEIAEDVVDRLSAGGRRALGRYIAGLDAFAISQYMDLTAAVPVAERASRLPTADEVAEALRLHERDLRRNILQGALGIAAAAIPPFHIGEFGVGTGGLKHPNLWSGPTTAEEELALSRQIARAHEGLVRYLREERGRTALSAVLWVTGPHYDIFGWRNPAYAIPEAAAAIRAGLAK